MAIFVKKIGINDLYRETEILATVCHVSGVMTDVAWHRFPAVNRLRRRLACKHSTKHRKPVTRESRCLHATPARPRAARHRRLVARFSARHFISSRPSLVACESCHKYLPTPSTSHTQTSHSLSGLCRENRGAHTRKVRWELYVSRTRFDLSNINHRHSSSSSSAVFFYIRRLIRNIVDSPLTYVSTVRSVLHVFSGPDRASAFAHSL